IDKSDYKFEKHPVLNFNMAYAKISTPDDLVCRIEDVLKYMAVKQNVTITANSYDMMLEQLLDGIYNRHGVHAVILVDEYDAPVTRHISDPKLASANRDVLHDFYQSIKTNIKSIHFAFVTGITRFAMTSLDSGPNNFKDISLMSQFSGICGFTIKEFKKLFKNRFTNTLKTLKKSGDISQDADIDALKDTILCWYDGYNWLGPQNVLNPYSILNFFSEKRLGIYWPTTGMPSHLSQLAQERPLDFIQPKLDSYLFNDIKMAELGKISPGAILFHSGYLTIDRRIPAETRVQGETITEEAFILKIPNREVALHFKSNIFIQIFNTTSEEYQNFSKDMKAALSNLDSVQIMNKLHNLLAGITFRQHTPSEQFYHSLFHAAFVGAGIDVMSETAGSKGLADMAVFLDDGIRVVIELKYRSTSETEGSDRNELADKVIAAALDEAEKAIREKDYAGPFRLSSRKIFCLALAVLGRDRVAARFVDCIV
ncbi:MAG: ATP-binding protein, partial [Deltaproteobacteria bacterium]|nr:ATP-binding protein [Deltaproteobacteria bacterium]